MTDKQIVKALECCITGKSYADCESMGCPLYLGITLGCKYVDNENKLYADALDLIKRQQAEIERLQKVLFKQEDTMQIIAEEKQQYFDELQTAKSEAVREFAERLKNEIIIDTAYGCDSNQHIGYYDYTIKIGDIPEYIDNIVKEMVGEEE